MAYDDKSIDPTSLTQSGTDVLPGFFAGKYAMVVGGNYAAQQIVEQAPKGFQWEVLPPLKGTSSQAGREPADPVGAGREQAHRAGGEVHRLLHEGREPGRGRPGRLADPDHAGGPGRGPEGDRRQERLGRRSWPAATT